jgi:hypothetical protein
MAECSGGTLQYAVGVSWQCEWVPSNAACDSLRSIVRSKLYRVTASVKADRLADGELLIAGHHERSPGGSLEAGVPSRAGAHRALGGNAP